MIETNINAYRQELVVAERELQRAQERYDSIKAHIKEHDVAEKKEAKSESDQVEKKEQPKLEAPKESESPKENEKEVKEAPKPVSIPVNQFGKGKN